MVRAAVTGAFLMNLLIIPGLSMLAAGFIEKEVKLNRKVQSVSGTILFLAIFAEFFPAIYYNLYKKTTVFCEFCNGQEGRYYFSASALNPSMNCSLCNFTSLANLDDDPVYVSQAKPLCMLFLLLCHWFML